MTAPKDQLSEDEHRELSTVLWSYRAALRRVEFLLEAQLVFARSGSSDRFGVIADLLDESATAVCHLDLRRELLMDRDTNRLSLAEIADTAEEPWKSMFVDHRDCIADLVADITQLTEQCRRAMGMTLDLIDQLLTHETPSDHGVYDRRGRSSREPVPSVLFDSRA